MLSNQQFLSSILTSFKEYIKVGTSRSTAKLKPLHGAIAADIAERLGEQYEVHSQGYGDGKEMKIEGRYIDKMVDITILKQNTRKAVAGIAVKFVMQNYSQNSNNYFENMFGETANIRSASCPYFQVFIILDRLPYYERSGKRTKWEGFTGHNMRKYGVLAEDNAEVFMHTPNKTLIYVIHILPEAPENIVTKKDYESFYQRQCANVRAEISSNQFEELNSEGTIILNDYEAFSEKVYHAVMAM